MIEYAVGREQVRDIERTLADLDGIQGALTLNFTNHWADDDGSPALLAAALMGPFGDRPLVVDAEDEETVDSLVRFGLATALSRRPAGLTTFKGPVARLDRQRLGLLWTPGTRDATASLFGTEQDATEPYGPRDATFVNPHLSTGPDGNPDVVYLLRRWLTRRLERRPDRLESVVATVALVVSELIQNVQEHAAGQGAVEPDCLLRLSLAGGEQVRVTILDTGVGLDRSLAPKTLDAGSPATRLRALLKGALPGWDAGRGIGLARVAQDVAQGGGRMSVATDALRAFHGADGTKVVEDGFPLRGTIVACTVQVPADL